MKFLLAISVSFLMTFASVTFSGPGNNPALDHECGYVVAGGARFPAHHALLTPTQFDAYGAIWMEGTAWDTFDPSWGPSTSVFVMPLTSVPNLYYYQHVLVGAPFLSTYFIIGEMELQPSGPDSVCSAIVNTSIFEL